MDRANSTFLGQGLRAALDLGPLDQALVVQLPGVLQGLLEFPRHALLDPKPFLQALDFWLGLGLLVHQSLAFLKPLQCFLLQL
jgi:hypothetical protein